MKEMAIKGKKEPFFENKLNFLAKEDNDLY